MKVHWVNRYVVETTGKKKVAKVITACGREQNLPPIVAAYLRITALWEYIILEYRCKICQRAYLKAQRKEQ